jgi:hypothetical protein
MSDSEPDEDIEYLKNILKDEDPDIQEEDLNIVKSEPPLKEFSKSPEFKTRIYIEFPYLKELTEKDFDLESPTLISLKREYENNGNWLILFTDESVLGKNYLQRILEIARILKNDYCKIGYANLSYEKKILENFKKLSNIEEINNPFWWARLQGVPWFLVYRNFWPVGYYSGKVNQTNLATFIVKKVGDSLAKIDKEDFLTNVDNIYGPEIDKSEEKIKTEELLERAKEEDKQKKEDITKINPREQIISDSVDLDD